MRTVKFEGMTVRIDRPKGFVQNGKDKSGKPWKRVYQYDYGYIPKTNGGDGEGLDVFLGPNEDDSDTAYWIAQYDDDGTFDEYKVFLGFKDKATAKKVYKDHIPAKYMGAVFSVSIPMMRTMLNLEPIEKLASSSVLASFFSELEALGVI